MKNLNISNSNNNIFMIENLESFITPPPFMIGVKLNLIHHLEWPIEEVVSLYVSEEIDKYVTEEMD